MNNININHLSGPFHVDYHLSFDILLNFIKSIKNYKNIPIISIGSGNNYLEYLLKTQFDNLNIICIEPETNIYNKIDDCLYHTFCIPTFPKIDNNILKYKNKCICLIIWPYPDDFLYGPYDVKALELLNPIGIFVTYDLCGCAGSSELIEIMDNTSTTNKNNKNIKKPKKIININKTIYNLHSCITMICGKNSGFPGKALRISTYFIENYTSFDISKYICQKY